MLTSTLLFKQIMGYLFQLSRCLLARILISALHHRHVALISCAQIMQDADKKGLSTIAEEVKILAQKAKENNLKPEDYEVHRITTVILLNAVFCSITRCGNFAGRYIHSFKSGRPLWYQTVLCHHKSSSICHSGCWIW